MISKAILQVERISALSRETFVHQYLKPHRPVILTDVVSKWPAFQRWSLEYLQAEFADHRVLVEHYPGGERYGAYTYAEMSVGEYIERVVGDPESRQHYYLADSTLDSTLPGSVKDVPTPEMIPENSSHRPVVFIGCDTFSAAHYHRNLIQAFLCQLQGRKEVRLYPAAHTKYLYPNPWYTLRTNFSRIPMDFGDHGSCSADFPKFDQAEIWECVVEPGEMLFIPDHWMHSTAGIGENISVTHFWNESWRYCYLPGLIRDFAAASNKNVLLTVARASRFLGIQKPLVQLASKLGIVSAIEQAAVHEHLANFGATSPAKVNASQRARNGS